MLYRVVLLCLVGMLIGACDRKPGRDTDHRTRRDRDTSRAGCGGRRGRGLTGSHLTSPALAPTAWEDALSCRGSIALPGGHAHQRLWR